MATSFKTYNPDFAYLINKNDGKNLFIVVETKGYDTESEIPLEEQQKINYTKKFFDKLDKELPDIQVAFKTRITTTDLVTILKDIEQGA